MLNCSVMHNMQITRANISAMTSKCTQSQRCVAMDNKYASFMRSNKRSFLATKSCSARYAWMVAMPVRVSLKLLYTTSRCTASSRLISRAEPEYTSDKNTNTPAKNGTAMAKYGK